MRKRNFSAVRLCLALHVLKGSMKENSSSDSLSISPTMTTTMSAITPPKNIHIYSCKEGAKEKKYSPASVFWLIEWLPGPGEILQLSVFLTEPLFWSLLFDGGPQRVWHPAKCLRLAATLEAVIMARRCLATQASASPRCTDIIFLSQGGAETEPLLALWEGWRCPVVISVVASRLWMCFALWLHFILYSITSTLVLWFIAPVETSNASYLQLLYIMQPGYGWNSAAGPFIFLSGGVSPLHFCLWGIYGRMYMYLSLTCTSGDPIRGGRCFVRRLTPAIRIPAPGANKQAHHCYKLNVIDTKREITCMTYAEFTKRPN